MDTALLEVPPFFLCPISLEIMKDPVTLSTGITYDRETIEKWLFSGKNNTCPVTKQILHTDTDFIPNVTLRRLIQAWCTVNASQEIERFPTPKPVISKTQLLKLLNEAKSPQTQIKCLQKLKSICSRNQANKRALETGGAAEFLASIVNNAGQSSTVSDDDLFDQSSNEALSLLYSLQLSESGLKSLFQNNGEFVESLILVMQRGSYDSRAYAALLLKSMAQVADEMQLITLKPVFFFELVELLRDQISPKVSKAALKLLINVCPYGRNRIKAAEAGAVPALIDILLDSSEKRETEMILIVLEMLCQCPEGRSELLNHGAGLAIVSKKILRVSPVASERGVKILHLISRFSATPAVVQEMLSLGVVTKLCFVLQVECGSKMKGRAAEILKQNAWAWRNSTCIPMSLLPSYPAC